MTESLLGHTAISLVFHGCSPYILNKSVGSILAWSASNLEFDLMAYLVHSFSFFK